MIKVLFMIHDLGQGGAEKVLVNLANGLDKTVFDVTVMTIFADGVNEKFLDESVHYRSVFKYTFPGNSKIFKLFSPKRLNKLFIKDNYDIEISFLEGPTARIISGNSDCPKVSWIHTSLSKDEFSSSFRNSKEAIRCYKKFNKIVCVSEDVKQFFSNLLGDTGTKLSVIYNVLNLQEIRSKAQQPVFHKNKGYFHLVAVGSLKEVKGFDRLISIIHRLKNAGYNVDLSILGIGPMEEQLRNQVSSLKLENNVNFLGYQTNPYQYIYSSDLMVCSSHKEGFSTAISESLILGIPVCSVSVSGITELLGENSEYGLVTENSEDALYYGICSLLENPELLRFYRQKSIERGNLFDKEKSIRDVESLLLELHKNHE